MKETGQPEIIKELVLNWTTMFCDKHISQYVPAHGQAAEQAMLLMAQELMYDKRFHGLCMGDTNNFERVASVSFKPVCCYLGDNAMRRIYAQTGVL